MSIYNFRIDINNRETLMSRLKEKNTISMGWGGAKSNLDLRNNPNFKDVYNISSRISNSIKKITHFKDGDILIIPKLPNNGKFIIGIVDGNYPKCYSYIENDQTHLNHCIKLKKIYGINSELDIHNLRVREWYAKLGWMRLPIYPLFRYETLFQNLLDVLDTVENSELPASKVNEYLIELRNDIRKKIKTSLANISPNNGGINFERVCRDLIESFGYKYEDNNHHSGGGDADLIFSINYEDGNFDNPFIRKEDKLYVQIKKHSGESSKKAVEQIITIMKNDKCSSAQGCAITLGSFNTEAQNLADENGIILINGDDLVDLIIDRLL